MSQKKNLILTTSESSDLDGNFSLPDNSTKSISHSYHSTLNNNKQLFQQQKHNLILNNNNNNNSNNESNETPSLSANNGTNLVITSTLRRLSLREREQVVYLKIVF